MPADHTSHDHLNEQKQFEVSGEMRQKWKKLFAELHEKVAKSSGDKGVGEKVVWGLVDGFLLYWDDVRRFYLIHASSLQGC